jgi:hypothetical protein
MVGMRLAFVMTLALISSYASAAQNQAPEHKPPLNQAPEHKPPLEVQVTSLPASSQPVDVNIRSMPAVAPPQVTVNVPKDDSARQLVYGTWGLFAATFVLAIATCWIGLLQSRDTKRRERAAMMREGNLSAQKVMVEAKRVEQLAKQLVTARTQLSVLAGQGGLPPTLKVQMEQDLAARVEALTRMTDEASFVVTDNPDVTSPLAKLSDAKLIEKLWRLDTFLVRLDAMRDSITTELTSYENESSTLRQQRTTLQAAAVTGRLAQHPKDTLG